MQLSSSAFSSGSAIPRRFTSDGEDLSPPLDWRAVPPTTRSLVLLCDDPDAPAGKWHHWAAYDIGADQTGLAEGAGHGSGAARFRQAINDFHRAGYGGPCPAPRSWTASLSLPFAGAFGRPLVARRRALLQRG
jgi:Raf kinase inhibitor-like YbhB/YbcL family protein